MLEPQEISMPRQITIHGGIVERPRKSWTPTIQALLQHLHAQGLPVPKPLGLTISTNTSVWSPVTPETQPGNTS